jgi:hypothetical protein
MVGIVIFTFKKMTMKKIFLSITTIFVLTVIMVSCKKDVVQNDNQVGSSKITYYATITVLGDVYMADSVGVPFVDPGATAATTSGDNVPVIATGTVDVSTPGVYTINYSATNKDGYSISAARHVAVYSTDASADTNNLSGNYLRGSTGSTSIWSKIAPGVYVVMNPGGYSGDSLLTAVVLNPTGFIITMPSQQSSNGSTIDAVDTSAAASPLILYDTSIYINHLKPSFAWIIENSGYGTGPRLFTKQ